MDTLWLISEQMHFIKSWTTSRTIGQKIPYSTRNHLGNQNGKRNHYKNSLESNPAVMSNLVCIFYCVYVLTGITDFLDGFIARRTRTTSQLGAKIDMMAEYNLCSGLPDKILT